MTTAFWTNTIWYILLGILCIIQIIALLKKANNRKHVTALYLIIAGITFSFEATIYLFLKAYDYYPMIFPQSPLNDGLAGNLFSQFSVTASALLISVLNLKYYWFLIFSLIYGFIEELFLRLGIYSHNWYQTWMTILGLNLLFWVTKKMYTSKLMCTNFLRYILMFFGLYTLHMPTIVWPLILLKIFMPKKILPDAISSFALICLLNLFLMSTICMIIYFSKLRYSYKSILICALYGILYFAVKFNIIYVKSGWFLLFSTADVFGMLLGVFILDKLISFRLKLGS